MNISKLRELAQGFDEKAIEAKWSEIRKDQDIHQEDFIAPGYNAYEHGILNLCQWQHSRSAKLTELLLAVIEVQQDAINKINIVGLNTDETVGEGPWTLAAIASDALAEVESLIEKAGLK